MGSSLATNVVNEASSILISTVTDTAQTCSAPVQQINIQEVCNITIPPGPGSQIIINQTNIQSSNISLTCTQSNAVQNNISANLNATVQQVSKATVGALGVGSAKSQNVTNLYNNLAIAILNTFNQNCIGGTSQESIQEACNQNYPAGTSVLIDQTNEQFSTQSINCIQTNQVVNDIKAQIVTEVSQEATATVEGILGPLIFILILVTIIIIVIFVGPELLLTNPNFIKFAIILIIVLIVAYLIIAAIKGWWPFRRSSS